MPVKQAALAVQQADSDERARTSAAHIAAIVAVRADGAPTIQYADGSIASARLAVLATREHLDAAIARRQQTVVLFENGDRLRPLIVGFIETPALHVPDTAAFEHDTRPQTPRIEADVDGRRVRLTAQDEIVLQCGKASVTLRRNGRVIIRGTYVESHSQGTNRIKGGQVQIN
jgi:hypothetical protein